MNILKKTQQFSRVWTWELLWRWCRCSELDYWIWCILLQLKKKCNEMCSVIGVECTVALGIQFSLSLGRSRASFVMGLKRLKWLLDGVGQIGAISRVIWPLCWCGRMPVASPPHIIHNRQLALKATVCSGTGGGRFALVYYLTHNWMFAFSTGIVRLCHE